jgi:sec-independent protein translocase protein TatA
MNLFVIAGIVGGQEIIVILVIVLLLFGGKKIPELMKGLGQGMKEFKNASKGEDASKEKADPDKIER